MSLTKVESSEQERLRSQAIVYSVMHDSVFIMTPDGRTIDCNDAAELMTGFARDELIGRVAGSQTDPVESDARVRAINKHFETYDSWKGDIPFRHKGGELRISEAVVVAVRNSVGDFVQAISVSRDVTEERRMVAALRVAEERFRLAFEHAPLGTVMTGLGENDRGLIRDMNPALCRMLGYTRDEIVGQISQTIFEPTAADQEIVTKIYTEIFEKMIIERRLIRRNGSTLWANLTIAIARDEVGRPLHTITQVEDITEKRAAQERLNKAYADLERANSALTATNEELEHFTSAVAHDLKGPLTSIKGYSSLLADENEILHSELRVKAVEAIERGADRMRVLIDDLLDYARASSEPLAMEAINMNDLVEGVVLDHPHILTGATVSYAELPTVFGHPALLRQLMANLISNAAKYVAPGVSPEINVEARMVSEGWELSIADNGIGIPAAARNRIFQMFHREVANEYDGTGIGLATCKRIVDRHGGRIWVSDRAESGSVFHFILPTH